MTAWAAFAYGSGGLAQTSYGWERSTWALYVLHALALMNVVLAVYMWWRHEPITPFVAPAAFASFVLTALAWFIGGMAMALPL